MIFASSDLHRCFPYHIAVLLFFSEHLDLDDHTSGQIVSGLDATCFDGVGNDAPFRYIQLFSGHDMVTITKFPDILQESYLASVASRSPSEKVCNSAFFLQGVIPCALQRVLLPCGSSRLSGGVRFDVVRDLLVLGNHLPKENLILPPIFVDSNFFGQEACDVVPVRDDQVACPTSSRIQSVSDEYSRKHLCTEMDDDDVCLSW